MTALSPTAAFAGLATGARVAIPLQLSDSQIANTDVMPNFYLTAPGLLPVLVAFTATEEMSPQFSLPLVTRAQQLRSADDATVIATAATRFAATAGVAPLSAAAVAASLIPQPLRVNVTGGAAVLDLSRGVALSAPGLPADSLAAVAARFALLGVPASPTGVPVVVRIDATVAACVDAGVAAEGYALSVTPTGVDAVGCDAAGAFYALMSLAGLVPAGSGAPVVPLLAISFDAPRYPTRALGIDESRNFHNLAALLRIVDQMAAYKLNQLHLHLSDDEGFRIEIAGLPELTGVGAKRCHDPPGQQRCLLPQLGSGPFASNSGTGFLSRADYITLLRAARARFVEVVPEIDGPGHARAAIRAMDARAAAGDASTRLSCLGDKSEFESVQDYNDNVMCVCQDSTFTFMALVMDDLIAMHRDAGAPLVTFHLGADEAPKGAWVGAPQCSALIASLGSADALQPYYVERVNALAQARGLRTRAWSDGLRSSPGGPFLNPATDLGGNNVSANNWTPLPWWDDSVPALAAAGYDVILTQPDYLYLDMPQEADPLERGYYWATRASSLQKVFSFVSGNLAANSQLTLDRLGLNYSSAFAGAASVTQPQRVVGLEGALWSETVRTDDELAFMIFPRLLALAERAWHRAAWEPADGMDAAAYIDRAALDADWARFAAVLGHRELAKLDAAGIAYRIDLPGAVILGNGTLSARCMLPGLPIEYLDARGAWVAYDAAKPPTLAATRVRATSPSGARASRDAPVPSP